MYVNTYMHDAYIHTYSNTVIHTCIYLGISRSYCMYVYVGLHSTVEFAAKGLELAKSTAGFDYTKFTLGLPFYGRYSRTTPYLYVLTYIHTCIHIHTFTYLHLWPQTCANYGTEDFLWDKRSHNHAKKGRKFRSDPGFTFSFLFSINTYIHTYFKAFTNC